MQGGPIHKEPQKVHTIMMEDNGMSYYCTSALQARHVLTFWSDGFTVDSGPLRNGESEEDRPFLASVSKG